MAYTSCETSVKVQLESNVNLGTEHKYVNVPKKRQIQIYI